MNAVYCNVSETLRTEDTEGTENTGKHVGFWEGLECEVQSLAFTQGHTCRMRNVDAGIRRAPVAIAEIADCRDVVVTRRQLAKLETAIGPRTL